MTQVNANVTPAKTFVKDANGEALVTVEDLNLLGVPAVSVDLAGKVAAADLAAEAVTAVKLAAAVADLLRTAVATVGDEETGAGTIAVTVQVKDAQGNNLAEKTAFCWWLSDAAAGAATATIPSGGVAVTPGVEVTPLLDRMVIWALTDATGAATLTFTEAGALTRYFNMVLGDDLIAGSQALVWAA